MTNPTNTLYDSRSTDIPSNVSRDLLAIGRTVRSEDCPWVEVGHLYLSVTITGDQSWLPLLARLYGSGMRKFSVFSGRHGDIPNIVDSTRTTQNVFDIEHTQEDVKKRTQALIEFTDVTTIEIVDTGSPVQRRKLQKQWLTQEATQRLKVQTSVIFAWCYSLFTMCEYHRKVEGGTLTDSEKADYDSQQLSLINRPISEIVNTFFPWAMRANPNARRRSRSTLAAREDSSRSGDVLHAATKAATSFADKPEV